MAIKRCLYIKGLLVALSATILLISSREPLLISMYQNKGKRMKKKSPLHEYHTRRDFIASPEPYGSIKMASKEQPLFVIQKHDASHLHYDVRLEIDGVLKSWAVPKGPSTDPKEKRLAMPTDDHPLEYATFEGTIPEGEYGAGTVMVWDIGTFENLKHKDGKPVSLEQSYKDGQVEVFLHGKKLEGAYTFIRLGTSTDKVRWLMIKMRDEYANKPNNPVINRPKSALTNRTLAQIKKESDE